MKIESYFNIKNIGKLYIDKILFEFEKTPIVFTCLDESKENMYLTLCNGFFDEQTWLIFKVNIDELISLIKNEYSVYETFKNTSEKIIIATNKQGNFEYHNSDFMQIPNNELPDKEECLDLTYEEQDNLILYFKECFTTTNTKEIINVDVYFNEICKSFNELFLQANEIFKPIISLNKSLNNVSKIISEANTDFSEVFKTIIRFDNKAVAVSKIDIDVEVGNVESDLFENVKNISWAA